MDPDSSHRTEHARLIALIADSDAICELNRGSEDPVAIGRVTDALMNKANALAELQRFPEAVAVWDQLLAAGDTLPGPARLYGIYQKASSLREMSEHARVLVLADELLALFDGLDRPEHSVRVAAGALWMKASALDALERPDEASHVDAELLERFGDHPDASEAVTIGLCNTARRMLRRPEQIDDALGVSEQLKERIEAAPDALLASIAESAVIHIRDLSQAGSPSLRGVAELLATITAGAGIEAVRAGHRVISRRLPQISSALPAPDRLETALAAIKPLERRRRRFAQTLAISHALNQRIGASEDPELRRLSATAKLYEGTAYQALGQFSAGSRAHDTVTSGQDSGAAQAFQWLAGLADTRSRLESFGLVATLRLRAETLGGQDDAITQLAYDDSIRAIPPPSPNLRFIRLIARLFRPRARTHLVVPDHPPGPDPN